MKKGRQQQHSRISKAAQFNQELFNYHTVGLLNHKNRSVDASQTPKITAFTQLTSGFSSRLLKNPTTSQKYIRKYTEKVDKKTL